VDPRRRRVARLRERDAPEGAHGVDGTRPAADGTGLFAVAARVVRPTHENDARFSDSGRSRRVGSPWWSASGASGIHDDHGERNARPVSDGGAPRRALVRAVPRPTTSCVSTLAPALRLTDAGHQTLEHIPTAVSRLPTSAFETGAAGAAVIADRWGALGAWAAGAWPGAPRRYHRDACALVTDGLAVNVLHQTHATSSIAAAVCDHLSSRVGSASAQPLDLLHASPLVLSLHGPPGVGKSLAHRVLALGLWGVQAEDIGRCPGAACPGYLTLYGVAHSPRGREEDFARLHGTLTDHLRRHRGDALVVVEEYDRLDCRGRALVRRLLDRGRLREEGVDAAGAVFVLESNAGMGAVLEAHARGRSGSDAGDGTDDADTESAERDVESALKDAVFAAWAADGEGCDAGDGSKGGRNNGEEARSGSASAAGASDGSAAIAQPLRAVAAVDHYIPFLPLTVSDLEALFEGYLRLRYAPMWEGGGGGALTWDASVPRWLAKQVETAPGTDVAVEGASGVPGAVTRHVTRGALRGLTGGVARGASAAVHLSVHPRGGGLVAEVTTSME